MSDKVDKGRTQCGGMRTQRGEERDARGWGHKLGLWRRWRWSHGGYKTEKRIETGTQKDGCEGEETKQGVGDVWDRMNERR